MITLHSLIEANPDFLFAGYEDSRTHLAVPQIKPNRDPYTDSTAGHSNCVGWI